MVGLDGSVGEDEEIRSQTLWKTCKRKMELEKQAAFSMERPAILGNASALIEYSS